ncbi:helix-turn-helix transcriptional regulator [Tunturibacter empetritectus]|uniref:DNA-binding transcriptional regulator AlpA n=1 Tax=Tunturiibacter empetritectus TaxID=3069691 RepID=A0A7W8ILD3_9BACT|nr:helix-turn-helix domain-containing protein [Edaphobacter lichenicola]MBB5319264.1 putative DNA-binding transcriptional regulator AlpA [Edaphobacter lichenicola]
MSNQVSAPERWVDIKAVCDHIGFSLNTVTRRVNEGRIPSHPIRNGKRNYHRFKLSEVDTAIKAGWTR